MAIKKKDNAIVTIVNGDMFKKIHAITKPSQLAYARRLGAKYVTMGAGDNTGWDPNVSAHWMKMKLFQYLEEYERIIFLDSDIIVHPECPDLFKMVPPTHLGAYNEGSVDGRGAALTKALQDHKIRTRRPYLGEYFNSGVMVLSQVHQGLFVMPDEIHNNFYEQSLLNARAFASYLPMCDIGYKFNRMGLLDNITGESRHASWIIHYAGKCYALREETGPDGAAVHTPMIIDVIKDDLQAWAEKRPIERNILVECEGGLGDVVCSEPVLRYAIEELYKDDPTVKFTLLTHRERVFKHFEKYPNVTVTKGMEITGVPKPTMEMYLEKAFGPYTPVARWHTHPPSDHVTRIYYPYSSVHNLDFGMNTLIRDSIPPEAKKIKLETADCDFEELEKNWPVLEDSVRNGVANGWVAIHPGTGWESKTFPVEYWNEIISGVKDAGLTPVVIGHGVDKEHGVLPVTIPDGAVDLRDKLSLGGLFAVISLCPVLISNDSSPVHIAGAFDNWIVMIATCKRPELVFPFRNGSVNYKTVACVKKLTRDALGNLPTNPSIRSMAELEGNIMDYLPAAKSVVKAAFECFGK